MLKLTPLFSSSKGNCTYIETDSTSLLVDIGISCKRLVNKLEELKINPETIEAILVTHDISEAIAMSDKIIVLSKRPASIINIHEISIECEERTPLKTRTSKEFREYFDKIWNELNEEK